jgi:hypothetical protein
MYSAKQILEAIDHTIRNADIIMDSPVYGRIGKLVEITVPSNPASGYQWVPDYDPGFLTLITKDRISQSGDAWTGKDRFVFRAEQAGTSKVVLNLSYVTNPSVRADSKTYGVEIYDTENFDQVDRLAQRDPYL